MQLYGLKTCDTCRKALKSIASAEFFDVRIDGIPSEVLDRALQIFGTDLINTRSTTWRGLDEDTRARPLADVLRYHPAVMKRPLIVDRDKMYLGWRPEVREALGLG